MDENYQAEQQPLSTEPLFGNLNRRCLKGQWRRDWQLLLRTPAQSLHGLQLFALIGLLLPLSVSADPALLREVGNGMIWVACLLSSLLGINAQLRQDFVDGGCQALLRSPCPLELLIIVKWAVHWLIVCLPIVILAPALAWTYGFAPSTLVWLGLSLLLTTPVVCAISILAVIFSAGVRGGDLLSATIALPLFLPVAVVGSDAVAQAHWQGDLSAHLYFMSGLLIGCFCLFPWATAAALRLSVENQ